MRHPPLPPDKTVEFNRNWETMSGERTIPVGGSEQAFLSEIGYLLQNILLTKLGFDLADLPTQLIEYDRLTMSGCLTIRVDDRGEQLQVRCRFLAELTEGPG